MLKESIQEISLRGLSIAPPKMLIKRIKQSQTRHGGTCEERTYSSYLFLTSELEDGEWSAHALAALYPRERAPGTHWLGDLVGPTSGLETEARGKIHCLCRGAKTERPVVQLVVRHYTK
jgi:hypothetical protein